MIAALAVLLLGLQDPLPPSEADIEGAIKKGVKALINQIQIDNSGGGPASVGLNYDHNALVLYTLVHSGIDLQDEAVQSLLATALQAPLTRTYQVALTAVALAAIDPWKYQGRLSQCAQYLVDWQCDNGQWGYGDKYDPPVKTSPNDGGANRTIAKLQIKRNKKLGLLAGDNSNSQYAALGLKAVSSGGCEIEPIVLTKAIEWWEKSQQKNGGWSYHLDGAFQPKLGTYGSMTAGAVSSLIMLKHLKNSDPKVVSAVLKGLAWLAEHFTVEKNADCPPGSEDWHHYYLYALERVGDLYPTEKIGKRPWYALGANYLVNTQHRDGSWRGSNRGMLVADTCFALLFLERVARRPPVMTGGKTPPPK
jgi:hypothetical protein